MGFPVPMGPWLKDRFPAVVREFALGPRARRRGLFDPVSVGRLAAEHQAGAADHADRLWLLIVLEIWQRVFIDREGLDEVIAA
jgi:asparagine synthase (glutamine-hydrolysing)